MRIALTRHLLRAAALAAVPTVLAAQSPLSRLTTIGRVDSVYSPTLREQRPYLVYTPPSYADSTTGQRYPVLYVLDGESHFHSVTGLVQIMGTGVNGVFAMPEMIVVAIPNTNRMRDLSPSRMTTGYDGKPSADYEASGGMDNFLAFLRSELIPHIEARYRTAPYQVLVGHSLGGITAIQALYTMPTVFNAYVAIDPSLWWDKAMLLTQAKQRVLAGRWEQRALYVAQANTMNADDTLPNQHYDAIARFNAVMGAYNQSGLRYGFQRYDHDTHSSVAFIAEYDALRFVFADFQFDLARAQRDPDVLVRHFDALSARIGTRFDPPYSALTLLTTLAARTDSATVRRYRELTARYYPRSAVARALRTSGTGRR